MLTYSTPQSRQFRKRQVDPRYGVPASYTPECIAWHEEQVALQREEQRQVQEALYAKPDPASAG